jgi:hypothetical protein
VVVGEWIKYQLQLNKQTDDERTNDLIGLGIRKAGMGISKQI